MQDNQRIEVPEAPPVQQAPRVEEAVPDPGNPLADPSMIGFVVYFDPKSQGVRIWNPDKKKLRSWDFIVGMLAMATERAKINCQLALQKQMHEKANAAMEEEFIRQQLAAESQSKRILT